MFLYKTIKKNFEVKNCMSRQFYFIKDGMRGISTDYSEGCTLKKRSQRRKNKVCQFYQPDLELRKIMNELEDKYKIGKDGSND